MLDFEKAGATIFFPIKHPICPKIVLAIVLTNEQLEQIVCFMQKKKGAPIATKQFYAKATSRSFN